MLLSCCPLVRKFKVVTVDSPLDYLSKFSKYNLDDTILEADVNWSVGVRKQEPLINLEELVFWDVSDLTSTIDLLTVFAQLPTHPGTQYPHDFGQIRPKLYEQVYWPRVSQKPIYNLRLAGR